MTRLNIGGAASHVINLNRGLGAAQFSSKLISGIEGPAEGSMWDYARSVDVHPVLEQDMTPEASLRMRDIKALGHLVSFIRRERPHIVHTHTSKAGLLGRLAARMAGVPVVVHTYHGHVLQGYFNPRTTRLLRRLEQALARATDRIVAVSEEVRRDLIAYGVAPPEKIEVISLGLDLEPFLHCHERAGEFRSEVGLTNGARLVGIVGRLFPVKNHRLFLDAASRLVQQHLSPHFVVVGDGTLRSEMEQYAIALGLANRVIFTGWRQDVTRIYADLDVLVVSSDQEGTPVAAIEAMASGLPIVATRVGGLAGIVNDGESGYLVPPRDPDALADAIDRVLRHPGTAGRMGQAGRAIARSRYTHERLVSDMQLLYQSLLQQKGISLH